MKKIVICLLSIFTMLVLCSCSPETYATRTRTETIGNLQITYTYNDTYKVVVSKNIYDTNTGITTEYFYFYEDKGWGEQLIGVNVVTINKDGQIIDKYGD